MPDAADTRPTSSSRSREHDTANRGASAMRMRSPAAPCHRRCSATLSSMDARVCSRRRVGTSGLSCESIMHLPIVARSPVSTTASTTASVSCTVSIVSTVVVPERSSSAAARRAAAAQRGRRVRRFERPDPLPQPLEQRQVVGQSAEQRLAQVDVRLDEAGHHEIARRVDDACAGRHRRRVHVTDGRDDGRPPPTGRPRRGRTRRSS